MAIILRTPAGEAVCESATEAAELIHILSRGDCREHGYGTGQSKKLIARLASVSSPRNPKTNEMVELLSILRDAGAGGILAADLIAKLGFTQGRQLGPLSQALAATLRPFNIECSRVFTSHRGADGSRWEAGPDLLRALDALQGVQMTK